MRLGHSTHFEVKSHLIKWGCRSGQLGQRLIQVLTHSVKDICSCWDASGHDNGWTRQEIGKETGFWKRSASGSWLPLLTGTWAVSEASRRSLLTYVGGFQFMWSLEKAIAVGVLHIRSKLATATPWWEMVDAPCTISWAVGPGRELLEFKALAPSTASVTS